MQVTYLGFPGNTGLQTIDYRLTDAYADPPAKDAGTPADTPVGASAHASEELVRLPETAWCFTPLSGSPAVGDLPALPKRPCYLRQFQQPGQGDAADGGTLVGTIKSALPILG